MVLSTRIFQSLRTFGLLFLPLSNTDSEIHVQVDADPSSGVKADGGDFDAANPGARKEADREFAL